MSRSIPRVIAALGVGLGCRNGPMAPDTQRPEVPVAVPAPLDLSRVSVQLADPFVVEIASSLNNELLARGTSELAAAVRAAEAKGDHAALHAEFSDLIARLAATADDGQDTERVALALLIDEAHRVLDATTGTGHEPLAAASLGAPHNEGGTR